ncbi:MAG: hypothetical protein AAFO91_05135, partial [Bacteroidota bacterium]
LKGVFAAFECMASVTCVSFFQSSGLRSRWKSFLMMQRGHGMLKNQAGLQFYKLMGSGRGNGFSPYADWGTYCLLTVWDNIEQARNFTRNSKLHKTYSGFCDDILTLYLGCIRAHGTWSDQEPFQAYDWPENEVAGPFCVLTRATIKTKFLMRFWRYVPTSSEPMDHAAGLYFKKGIGEVPVIQMATFSIWRDQESMRAYAYNSPEHLKAVRMTRELGWYSEELFARFRLLDCEGNWQGKPLKDLMSTAVAQ